MLKSKEIYDILYNKYKAHNRSPYFNVHLHKYQIIDGGMKCLVTLRKRQVKKLRINITHAHNLKCNFTRMKSDNVLFTKNRIFFKSYDQILKWDENFPIGYGHTSISFLKKCKGYTAAKNGDLEAAKLVVAQCAKSVRILELHDRYPEAILIPVMSQNMLPLALALHIGLPIHIGIGYVRESCRRNMSAMQRLLNTPSFHGDICRGTVFILVDDVVTQGGLMASLRRYILLCGGKIAAVVALAYACGSKTLALTEKNLHSLNQKFGHPLFDFLQDFGIATVPDHLTNSQAIYLLSFDSVKNMRKFAQKPQIPI